MIKRLTILILFASIHTIGNCQTYVLNQNCKQAYQSIFKLKFNEGSALLEKEKKENPKNYLPYLLENYIDFLKLFINDNTALYHDIEPRIQARLEKIKNGNTASPFYLYTQADIHLQYAFCKIKFGEYVSAVFEVRKAYVLLMENQKKFPDFQPNIKSLGLLHTLFGAIPDNYKFGARLLGLKGSINEGLKELDSILKDDNFFFREETIMMYTLLILHVQQDKKLAWGMIEQTNISLEDNLLHYFIAATVASHTGKNEKVVSILSAKPSDNTYYPFPFLNFMLGNAKLNKLDSDADFYIKKFISENKGRSYQKEANRKLAWYYLIHDKPELYRQCMQNVLSIKDAPTDEDKSAQKEAEQATLPNKVLLKARVLCDGGYFEKALETINSINSEKLTSSRDQIEFYYRKARILQELNNNREAIQYYLKTIQKGEKFNYYFAANACLKLAYLLEIQRKNDNAIRYFRKAIMLEKDEYQNSIDAEAKAGLNRLGYQ